LQEKATTLLLELGAALQDQERPNSHADLAMRNVYEITGGLAQTLPLPAAYELDDIEAGLKLTQLKRALRGAAFVAGSLFLLRDSGVMNKSQFKAFMDACQTISAEIVTLMKQIRASQAR
jgi:hypothetical protein